MLQASVLRPRQTQTPYDIPRYGTHRPVPLTCHLNSTPLRPPRSPSDRIRNGQARGHRFEASSRTIPPRRVRVESSRVDPGDISRPRAWSDARGARPETSSDLLSKASTEHQRCRTPASSPSSWSLGPKQACRAHPVTKIVNWVESSSISQSINQSSGPQRRSTGFARSGNSRAHNQLLTLCCHLLNGTGS